MNPLTFSGISCLIGLLCIVHASQAQNSNVSIGTESVKNQAILWLKAEGNQGLLLPVVSNRSTFTGLNNSDDKGMLIFDASDNRVYFWNGTAWIEAGGGSGGGSNQTLTLNGNTFTLSGSPASNVALSSSAPQTGQALVWNGSSWVATTSGGDVSGSLASSTVTGLKGSGLPATLPSTTSALVYTGSAWSFQALSSTGEANTASNVGTAGVGVFRQKTGVNLEFFRINSGSNRVTVTADNANNEVDIDVNQANLSIASTQVTGLGSLATLSAVGSAQITDGSITGADIANTTITANKLAQSSATTGQVLKWNGTAWVPQNDDVGTGVTPTLSSGQILVGNGTTNSGVALSGDATLSGGALTISNNAVTNVKIQNGTIGAEKLAQSGATNSQVLQWNGSAWAPATLASGGTVTQVSTGTGLTGGPITTTGTISIAAGGVNTTELANNAVTTGKILDGTITGADIANTTITANKLAQSSATDGQVLQWNGTNWAPASTAAGFSTTNILPKGDGSGMVASQLFDNGSFVGVNMNTPVTGADRFSIGSNAPAGSYGGMYIDTQTGGKPFYGFSQNAGGGAWMEWDGADANKLKFYNSGFHMALQTNGNLGIGTTEPEQKLDVVGYVRIGAGAGAANQGLLLATPSPGIAVITAGGRATTDFRITQSNNAPMSFYTSGAERMAITGTGSVGIGTPSPSNRLHVRDNSSGSYIALFENTNTSTTSDGIGILLNNTTNTNDYLFFMRTSGLVQGRISGNGSGAVQYLTSSDRRLKDNIRDYTDGLSSIMKMQPRRYVFKESCDIERIGFIAQELKTVYPEAVNGNENETSETDPMMVDYSKLTPALVNAIQQQQAMIDELKASKDNLEKRIAALEELLLKASAEDKVNGK